MFAFKPKMNIAGTYQPVFASVLDYFSLRSAKSRERSLPPGQRGLQQLQQRFDARRVGLRGRRCLGWRHVAQQCPGRWVLGPRSVRLLHPEWSGCAAPRVCVGSARGHFCSMCCVISLNVSRRSSKCGSRTRGFAASVDRLKTQGGDQSPHYNRASSGNNDGGYTPVCSGALG